MIILHAIKNKLMEWNPKYTGIVRLRELPDNWDEETFRYWWLPERDSAGYVVRSSRMSPREKERYTAYEHHNTMTFLGKQAILTYMSINSPAPPYAAYFAVGSGYTPSVDPLDTQINTEIYRKQPTGYNISGTLTDVSIYFGSTEAIGTYSNAGYYGGNSASATLGTGILMTHTIYSYVKGSLPVTNDYICQQS